MKPVQHTFRTTVDYSVFKKDVLERTKAKNAKRQFKATHGNNYKPVVSQIIN